MAKTIIKIASGVILTTATLNVSFADDKKFDHGLEAAAVAIAASKIGEIRNSIDYKQAPEAISQATTEQISKRVEKREWVKPRPRKTGPKRISSLETGLDYTATAGIEKPVKKSSTSITWQKFDRYGRPMKFLY